MGEIFERSMTIIMAVILMFFVPMIYFSLHQNLVIHTYVDNKTRELVNRVSVFGYLTKEMYLEYEKQLKATGLQYEITLIHSHLVVTPVYLDPMDRDTFQGTYVTSYDEIGHELIWNALFRNEQTGGCYYMDLEDVFEVQVVGLSKSWGDYLVGMVIPGYSNDQMDVWYRKPIRDTAAMTVEAN